MLYTVPALVPLTNSKLLLRNIRKQGLTSKIHKRTCKLTLVNVKVLFYLFYKYIMCHMHQIQTEQLIPHKNNKYSIH